MRLSTKIMLGAGITALLLFVPLTRMAILFILPLGKGVDDLAFLILLGVFLIVAFYKGWIRIPKAKKDIDKEYEDVQ